MELLVLRSWEATEQEIREFWENRGEEGATAQREVNQLRRLLFRRVKYPVKQDAWIPGASQLRAEQHVEAVVSEVFGGIVRTVLDNIAPTDECLEGDPGWSAAAPA